MNQSVGFEEDASLDQTVFEHIPYVGYRYFGDGRSIIISTSNLTKPGQAYNDRDIWTFVPVLQRYLDRDQWFGHPYRYGKTLTNDDFKNWHQRYAYKFVTEETYRDFVEDGSYLVSSLQRYRDMESAGNVAGDRFEGSCFGHYSVGDRSLIVTSIGAFDNYIFSASRDLKNVEYMRKKFGPIVLRIDLARFAKLMSRHLGSESFSIKAIVYADIKLFRDKIDESHIDVMNMQSEKFYRLIRRRSRTVSLFSKPMRFGHEREVRIAFQQCADISGFKSVKDAAFKRCVRRIY